MTINENIIQVESENESTVLLGLDTQAETLEIGNVIIRVENNGGDMTKAVYDTNNNGIVDSSESVNLTSLDTVTSISGSELLLVDGNKKVTVTGFKSLLSIPDMSDVTKVSATSTTTAGYLNQSLSVAAPLGTTLSGNALVLSVDLSTVASALNSKSDIGHNHDTEYAPLYHNHDSAYQPLGSYALETQLDNYATLNTLGNYATNATLTNYADLATLSNYALTIDIPTNTSELVNDSGFLTTILHNNLGGLNCGNYLHLTSTEINNLATLGTLTNYATNATLTNYASIATLSNYSTIAYSDYRWVDIERSGFVNVGKPLVTFDETTYTVTLATAGSWKYLRAGLEYTALGTKTIQLASPPATGKYYITINGTDGALSTSASVWSLDDYNKLPVSTVIWNASLTPKYLLEDERHSCLFDRRVHKYLHQTRGTQYISGGLPTGHTLGTTTDLANSYGVEQASIADEDMYLTLDPLTDSQGVGNKYLIMYRSGGNWIWKLSDMPYAYTSNGYIDWDSSGTLIQGTGGTGGSVRYYNYYLLFTNILGSYSYVWVPGQNAYTSATAAYGESFQNFTLTGFPLAEWVLMYQVTYQTGAAGLTNKGKVQTNRVQKIVSSAISVSLQASADHNSLSGLQGGIAGQYYHLTNDEHSNLVTTGVLASYSLSTHTHDISNITYGNNGFTILYTPNASDTVTLNLATCNKHRIQMPSGNITLALSNLEENKIFSILLKQDGIGGRTVTWFGGLQTTADFTLSTTASKTDTFVFYGLGTNSSIGYVAGKGA